MARMRWLSLLLLVALLVPLALGPRPALAVDRAPRGDIDLLIAADEPFLTALQPLKEHKDRTGIRTYLTSWQSLETAYMSEGRDAPERIKHALAAFESRNHIKYVMLVGDSDRFPVRYCRADNTEWGTKYYPSDLYYADLYNAQRAFDDWNANGDDYFGEMDFAGGSDINRVNVDRIHMLPELMVGRIPASTVDEVTTYVNKVTSYEFAAYQTDWFERALLVVDGGNDAFGDEGKMDALAGELGSFTVLKRYADLQPYAGMSGTQRAATVNADLNDGAGLVFYYGHGNRLSWAGWYGQGDLAGLNNGGRLPVVFASSCYTARFHFDLEYYVTAANVQWNRLNGPTTPTNHPLPRSVQYAQYDEYGNESLAEHFTVKSATGAIAYIGCVSKAEHGVWIAANRGLAHYFAGSYYPGVTLGAMWRYAMSKFITDEVIPEAMSWYRFIHIHKMLLFGDPSLRVGGISSVQKQDVAGTYAMSHDGWAGSLQLSAVVDDPIEQIPNLAGTWTAPEGYQRTVRGYMRTWSYPLPQQFGPDHKILMYIDFPGTLDTADDSRFEGYIFGNKEAMAGLTYWNGQPYGFYALKGGGAAGVGLPSAAAQGALGKGDFLGTYALNTDGWRATLRLWAVPDDPIEQLPNIRGTYTASYGAVHNVRGYVRTPTYPIDPSWGPNHKIIFYVDFADTPQTDDDRQFEGYLFTQTRDAMAGISYYYGTPYGFYALKESAVYLPAALRNGN